MKNRISQRERGWGWHVRFVQSLAYLTMVWREAPRRTEMISVSMMTMIEANVLVASFQKSHKALNGSPPLHPLMEHAMPLETQNSFPLCLQWANTKRLDQTQTSLSPWPWGLLLWDECGFISFYFLFFSLSHSFFFFILFSSWFQCSFAFLLGRHSVLNVPFIQIWHIVNIL